MKKKPTKPTKKVIQRVPKDTPATRKKRLQQRLREINERNEREMGALMKTIGRIKGFRSKRLGDTTNAHSKKSSNSS